MTADTVAVGIGACRSLGRRTRSGRRGATERWSDAEKIMVAHDIDVAAPTARLPRRMAPGTPLREGFERILRGRTGGLSFSARTSVINQISTGGFL